MNPRASVSPGPPHSPPHPDAQWRESAESIHPGLSPLWMEYTAWLHERLLRRWEGRLASGRSVLKTDLFEEARGEDHPLGRARSLGWRAWGMDVGLRIAAAARDRLGAENEPPVVLVTDARAIALRPDSVEAVFSNSTLDHFETREELERALAELHRVLAPGGLLMLTLDNPANPLIGLRNWLPRGLTEALGITEFYVGATLSLASARPLVERLGFEIVAAGHHMHGVRYFTLPLARLADRIGWQPLRRFVAWHLRSLEWFEALPTSRWTGHFIFIDARKRET